MSKTAIISGASSGIGAATAQKFIELGYTVVNIARRKSPVDNVINVSADPAPKREQSTLLPSCWLLTAGGVVALVHNASLMLKDTVHDQGSDELCAYLRSSLAL